MRLETDGESTEVVDLQTLHFKRGVKVIYHKMVDCLKAFYPHMINAK